MGMTKLLTIPGLDNSQEIRRTRNASMEWALKNLARQQKAKERVAKSSLIVAVRKS